MSTTELETSPVTSGPVAVERPEPYGHQVWRLVEHDGPYIVTNTEHDSRSNYRLCLHKPGCRYVAGEGRTRRATHGVVDRAFAQLYWSVVANLPVWGSGRWLRNPQGIAFCMICSIRKRA